MTVDHDRSHSRTYSRPHHDDNEPPPVEWNGIIGEIGLGLGLGPTTEQPRSRHPTYGKRLLVRISFKLRCRRCAEIKRTLRAHVKCCIVRRIVMRRTIQHLPCARNSYSKGIAHGIIIVNN